MIILTILRSGIAGSRELHGFKVLDIFCHIALPNSYIFINSGGILISFSETFSSVTTLK